MKNVPGGENSKASSSWRVAIAIALTFAGASVVSPAGAEPLCSDGNGLQDPGFEASTNDAGLFANPFWNSTSTVFGTSLCNLAECGDGDGTAGPRAGSMWVWFGGTVGPETGAITQAVTIPSGAKATLKYYLRVGAVEAPFTDVVRVEVDGVAVETISEPTFAESDYHPRNVNLDGYADGKVHLLSFEYDSPSGGGIANFSIDDVTLEIVCSLTTPTLNRPRVQFANISTRLAVGTGNNVLIGGFIVTGTEVKEVAVRGVGPSLTSFGVPGALGDPILELHDSGGALIAANDNWQTTQLGGIITDNQVAEIQNSGLAPVNPAEAAIIAHLTPGAYTAVLRGKNDTTGVGVVEAYDLSFGSNSRLANISTRGFVESGDKVMIGGVIVSGDIPTTVVVRTIGPSLSQVGIPNPLADPTLELHDGNGTMVEFNDNWLDGDESATVQTAGLAPSSELESALAGTFSPGAYTAIVRGKNTSSGVAVVEAYHLDSNTSAVILRPLTEIHLPGSGFDPGADVIVRFSGPNGFSFDAPAFDVTPTAIGVVVPPFLDPATQTFGPASVTLQVVQSKGSMTRTSNSLSGIQIADLPGLEMPPGTITANWASLLESELSTIEADLAAATAFSNGQVDTTDLRASLETCRARFRDLKELIRAQLAGNPNPPVVAVMDNVPVTLNASTLRQSDQLLLASLRQVLATAGQPSPGASTPSSRSLNADETAQSTSVCPLTTVQIFDAVIHTPNSDAIVNPNYAFYLQQCADYYRAGVAADFSHLALTLSVAGLVAPYTFPASGSAALILAGMGLGAQGIAARLDGAASALRMNDPTAFERSKAAWSGVYKGIGCFVASFPLGRMEKGVGQLFDIESTFTGICETEMPKYESLVENSILAPPVPTPTPTPSPTPTPTATPLPGGKPYDGVYIGSFAGQEVCPGGGLPVEPAPIGFVVMNGVVSPSGNVDVNGHIDMIAGGSHFVGSITVGGHASGTWSDAEGDCTFSGAWFADRQ